MNLEGLVAALKMPRPMFTNAIMNDCRTLTRLHFLYAAVESGLLRILRAPCSLAEAAGRMNTSRIDLLQPLLDLGVSLKELWLRDGRYGLKGMRARILSCDEGDAFAAFLQEAVAYHGSVYRNLTARMSGAPPGDYLNGAGALVARSSRTLEPLLGAYVRRIVRERRPRRLLEIGCGSGIYLLHAARACPEITGVGIDLQESVIQQARQNLKQWGIADRFALVCGDIRRQEAVPGGPFDFISMYNNLYYFDASEWPALFEEVRALLAPEGTFAIVSLMRGGSTVSRNFDVILRSTLGCAPLPDRAALLQNLKASAFREVTVEEIGPLEDYSGVIARI